MLFISKNKYNGHTIILMDSLYDFNVILFFTLNCSLGRPVNVETYKILLLIYKIFQLDPHQKPKTIKKKTILF